MHRVTPGLEVFLESPQIIGGRPWALLSNHAAVSTELESARELSREAVPGSLVRLFAP